MKNVTAATTITAIAAGFTAAFIGLAGPAAAGGIGAATGRVVGGPGPVAGVTCQVAGDLTTGRDRCAVGADRHAALAVESRHRVCVDLGAAGGEREDGHDGRDPQGGAVGGAAHGGSEGARWRSGRCCDNEHNGAGSRAVSTVLTRTGPGRAAQETGPPVGSGTPTSAWIAAP